MKASASKSEAAPAARRHPVMSRSFPDFFPGAGPAQPRIVARRWGDFQVRDPLAAVVIIHGLGEHSGRYTPFAEELVKRDMVVFSFDHRGHGRSDGMRMYADTLDELVADINAYVNAVSSNLPSSLPLFIFGHSMGGLLSAAFALSAPRPRVTGFIFSGPGFAPGESITSIMIASGRVLGNVAPTAGVATVDSAEISSIEEEVRRYRSDPLCSTTACTAGLGLALLNAVDLVQEKQSTFDYPALYFYGQHDKLVNQAGITRFCESQKHADKTIFVAPSSRHEVFYDVDSAPSMARVIDWIAERSVAK